MVGIRMCPRGIRGTGKSMGGLHRLSLARGKKIGEEM